MGGSIKVQASDINNASNQIDQIIHDYQSQYNRIYKTVDELKNAWKGSDNQAFCSKIEGFRQYFDKLNRLMGDYSGFLKQAAKAYSETQETITSAANRL